MRNAPANSLAGTRTLITGPELQEPCGYKWNSYQTISSPYAFHATGENKGGATRRLRVSPNHVQPKTTSDGEPDASKDASPVRGRARASNCPLMGVGRPGPILQNKLLNIMYIYSLCCIVIDRRGEG